MMFTEGGDVLAGRVNKFKRDEREIEIGYEYKLDNQTFIGSIKLISQDGIGWSGDWSQRNQRWQSSTGVTTLTLVENKERCFLYGTWGDPIEGEKGQLSLDIELPRSWR